MKERIETRSVGIRGFDTKPTRSGLKKACSTSESLELKSVQLRGIERSNAVYIFDPIAFRCFDNEVIV